MERTLPSESRGRRSRLVHNEMDGLGVPERLRKMRIVRLTNVMERTRLIERPKDANSSDSQIVDGAGLGV
ncbi:hypothetical protein TYRP_006202 [Tyrophagus putrescentiae]|nr:hypothetical protein TYRP_006202 [Tyrophagus putrescentiae]